MAEHDDLQGNAGQAEKPLSRTRQSFNRGWKFARFGPMPDGSTLPEPAGIERPETYDNFWPSLDLPHDWAIAGPFRPEVPNSTGKLPWAGIGWYRKKLLLPASAIAGKRVFLDFDGAMSHPKVFLDGELVGEWAYGYNSFRVELTPRLTADKPTGVIAVRLDNPPDSSRWYPGGGLYRNVWLVITDPVHVAYGGVFVRTPEVSAERATVATDTTVDNQSEKAVSVIVRQEVISDGRIVARADSAAGSIAPGASLPFAAQMPVERPKLWDIVSPNLYTLRTTVLTDGKETDRVETPFGIRTAVWDAEKGFLLNGRVVKLNGVCNHHDLGPLGSAVYTRGIERQLELLKEMGCNAIRTSHNMPAPELLDICDRMGFLVIDEAFDCWRRSKTRNDYARDFEAWHERDVVNFVRRDRNHPCVIAWSSGNEVPEQGNAAGQEVSRHLTALFKREDPTRPVTAGCNFPQAGTNGFSETFDLMGYNYKPHLYDDFHARYPKQPVYGSETASCVSSYGEYFFPVEQDKAKGFFNYQCSSYDLYAPPWAMKPDLEWEGLDRNRFTAGEFVWTGFDYLGEPTPYNADRTNGLNFTDPEEQRRAMELFERLGGKSPSRSSYFGILDLCGFKKDRFYIYQARWRPDLKMAHILPHWNWPNRVGQVTPVHVYTRGDEAELFLNGKSLGRRKKESYRYRLVWDEVKYEPGELKVIAYKQGRKWAEATRRTTGPAVALKLEADRNRLRGDGADLSFVTVKVVDARGDIVPDTEPTVQFEVTGPATLAALGNGDATCQTPFVGREYPAFHGLCLAVVRTNYDGRGTAVLRASAPGLKGAEVRVNISSD
jgi:beta-galactosidase